jgi:hypothetical protein
VTPGTTRARGSLYWILARRGDPLEEPHLYDGNGVRPWAARDPRRLRTADIRITDPLDFLLSGEWQLVTAESRGPVTDVMTAGMAAECTAGWNVTRRGLDPGPVTGPQHRQLRALARKARRIFESGTPASLAAADRHAAARAAIHADTARQLAWDASITAATAALKNASVDTGWWATLTGRHEYAATALALAARDLADAGAGGWTIDAYQYLTGPWRAATGQAPHPADADLAAPGTHRRGGVPAKAS